MQDLSHSLILLNGEFKTRQIEIITSKGHGAFAIKFKKNPKVYTYSADKVIWLTKPKWAHPNLSRVYLDGKLQSNVVEIWQFNGAEKSYWRLKYKNNYEVECYPHQVHIYTTCLDEKAAQDTFKYLTNVASINPLKEEDNEDGILYDIYNKIDFIDKNSAASCYLNPQSQSIGKLSHKDLIYPFGSNTSQKKAVSVAFEDQISIIQGPPGTGKTQTILNIIANAVRNNKTVLVVSNNNSATANIKEKLDKYGLSFLAATLGSRDNKQKFLCAQPEIPDEIQNWGLDAGKKRAISEEIQKTISILEKVYLLQNELATLKQERQSIALEWTYFAKDHGFDENPTEWETVKSSKVIHLWIEYQNRHDRRSSSLKNFIKSLWLKLLSLLNLGITLRDDEEKYAYILKFQRLYYLNRRSEIDCAIKKAEDDLSNYNINTLSKELSDKSMDLFKASLADRYKNRERPHFTDIKEMKAFGKAFISHYPIVLSTTFSARSCIFDDCLYDYIIMDEASQISIETGALALTCAKNAVIVGDNLQLPNVVTDEDRIKLNAIMGEFNIPDGYDCAQYSFLKSVCSVIKNVPQTLLREHYRCHPKIINFCNQKFYGGELLIMTQDKGEKDVMCAYKTAKGNHAINQFNQREIDVIKNEVLPNMNSCDDIGIITPYNRQVNECNRQLSDIETATIHKYQGREKSAIIMSVVDNEISEFSDNPKLLNVAVSRAKDKFCMVVSGNEQKKQGNIMDLLEYINYNNFTITESKVSSIFDYLYEQYTEQRIALLQKNKSISEYASENLTYTMLSDLLSSDKQFAHMKLLCHVPLRQIIRDKSLMSPEETRYASHYRTHVDFLIINRVTKKPIIAIETDGYSYHNEEAEQHKRDVMKNHIFELYEIPLMRLSTKGSGERDIIKNKLISIHEKL